MTKNSVWLNVEADRVVAALDESFGTLDNAGGELLLDFSHVDRLDAAALRSLEKLAGAADQKAVKIQLRGVQVGVYRVLKLTRLAPRLCFVN
jgi:anti-anti-sigma regulatory factor